MSDVFVESIDIFIKAMSENQIKIHKILLKNKLIDKPFKPEVILHSNPYGAFESIITVDFENDSIDIQHGKNIATKFARRKTISTDDLRTPIQKLNLKKGEIIGKL